ncbi:MAG: c-type cytochrome biogenesis protein CcsB [Acidobacteriota bacterium]
MWIYSLWIAIALYIIGLVFSSLSFITRRDALFRAALATVGIALLSHTLSLVALGVESRHFPLTNLRESCSFFAWAVTVSFFLSYLRYRIKALGLFILPLVATLLLAGGLFEATPVPEALRSSWIYIHIPLVFTAYAAFFVTFVASILYLFEERELKARRPGTFYYRLPPLQVLENLQRTALGIGFALMTLGIVSGALWAEQAWGQYWNWSDPKQSAAFATWLIYLVLVHYRLTAGYRGRKVAILSVLGFLSVLFTFLGVSFFKEGPHSF